MTHVDAVGIQRNTPLALLLVFRVITVEILWITRVCFGKTKHNIDNCNQKQRLGRNRSRSASKNIWDKQDYRGDDKRKTSQTRRTRHVGNNCEDSSSDDERFMNQLKTHHTTKITLTNGKHAQSK